MIVASLIAVCLLESADRTACAVREFSIWFLLPLADLAARTRNRVEVCDRGAVTWSDDSTGDEARGDFADAFDDLDDDEEYGASRRSRRRWLTLGAVLAVVGFGVASVVVRPDRGATERPERRPATAADSTSPAPSVPPTQPIPPTIGPSTLDSARADVLPDGTGMVIARVELDPLLADLDPVEVVALHGAGDSYIELLVPSGGLRTNALDPGVIDPRLTVGDAGTLVTDGPPPTDPSTATSPNGEFVAEGHNHTLVRRCDPGGACRLVALARDGSGTTFITDINADFVPVSSGGLAPTGDVLVVVRPPVSADRPPTLHRADLVDGTSFPIVGLEPDAASVAWAPDGSGFFITDRSARLHFVHRDETSAVLVSPDLPKVRSLHTRLPTWSAICELLHIALPLFDALRGDDLAPAPPAELLDDVRRVAPPALAADAEPLVSFVTAFVSPEQPESRRVANWPVEVRAGLAALEEHAESQC